MSFRLAGFTLTRPGRGSSVAAAVPLAHARTARSSELIEALPLALVENLQYIHNRKGSMVLYALKDETVLYLQKHRIEQASGTLEIVVDGLPYEAGIDPYNKLIDRVSDDNRRRVGI